MFATSPPLFTGIAGVALARLNRAPFVLDVRDLWPAAAEALAQISGGVMSGSALWLERWLYRRAAAVVAVTRPFCEHIDGIRASPPLTTLLPNGTLELFFDATRDGDARRELGAHDGEFLVTFAGTHGIAQALPAVLDAASRSGDGVQFSFVGEGPMKAALERQAAMSNLDERSVQLAAADRGDASIARGKRCVACDALGAPHVQSVHPSKMIDYMAVGRPVILAAAGEAARVLERSGGGVVVPPEDPQALAESIRWLAANPAEAAAMGQRGRAFAGRRLRSTQAERLEQLLFAVTRAH